MNTTPILTALALSTPLLAGPFGPVLDPAPLGGGSNPDAFSWLTPSVDIRTRYEFREVDGSDPSHALTARARAGLLLGEFAGFSAFGEVEATGVLVDDYKSNPTTSPTTDPFVLNNTPIGDPENVELNQAWAQYKNSGAGLKVGRQRIIRNNAAFIGNVGWRQNEQTYDAIEGSFANDDFSFSYVYSDRVQRIFGDDANDALPGPPLRDFEGEFHFIDGSYNAGFGTVGGYAYLIDVNNNTNVGESNTVGAFIKAGPVHAEAAWQDGSSTLTGPMMGAVMDYDAFYGHLIYTQKAGPATLTAGLEYLEENFKTPFATVHAFNGFADAFILQRIGLNKAGGGAYEGLSDFYLGYSQGGLPGGLVFKGFLHYFLDDGFSDAYGWEADAVLVKKINENVTALLAAAYFGAEDPGYGDIQQVSVQLDIKF